MRRKFKNADEAYNYFLDKIITDGIPFGDTILKLYLTLGLR
jgi:hypothetical protein